MNFGSSILAAFGTLVLITASGLIEAATFLVNGIMIWAKVTKDAYMKANEWMSDAGEELTGILDYARSWSRESWGALLCCCLAVYLQMDKNSDSSSRTSSEASSGAETLITPSASAVAQHQRDQDDFQKDLLAAFAHMQKSLMEGIQKMKPPADKEEDNHQEITRPRKKVSASEHMAMEDNGEVRGQKARRIASPARAEGGDPKAVAEGLQGPPGLSRSVEVLMDLPDHPAKARGSEMGG